MGALNPYSPTPPTGEGTLVKPGAPATVTLTQTGARPEVLGPTLPRGATLGRYVVLDRIGSGGMGVVYAAYDFGLDRKVCLKLVRGREDSALASERQARLLREAQAMARLSHPNTLAVHDVGTYEDQVFIAMELVEGCTLAEWLRARPRSWREVLDAFLQAGHGLSAAHQAGLVHRDFKPENVLVGRDGRVRVTDFGLAVPVCAAESEPEAEELLPGSLPSRGAGTLPYMAPEQQRGEPASPRSDQFSFCVALYEALYGERPFRGRSPEERASEVATFALSPALPSGRRVPASIRRLVLRGLHAAPAARHDSMEQLLDGLERVQRRRWLATALGASAVVTATAATAVAMLLPATPLTGAPPPLYSALACAAPLPSAAMSPAWEASPSGCEPPGAASARPQLASPGPRLREPPTSGAEHPRVSLALGAGLAPASPSSPPPAPALLAASRSHGDAATSWESDARRLLHHRYRERGADEPDPLARLIAATLDRLARLLEASGALDLDEAPTRGEGAPSAMAWALFTPQPFGPAPAHWTPAPQLRGFSPLRLSGPAVESPAVESLERALALRIATGRSPTEIAETRFALADALWSVQGDQKRAIELAEQARDTLTVTRDDPALLDEINDWLKEKAELRSSWKFSRHDLED